MTSSRSWQRRNVSFAVMVLVAACTSLGLATSAAVGHTRVLAHAHLNASHGGTLRTHAGVELFVPPHVMARDGDATITALGGRRYDVHINVPWKGLLQVTMPLRSKADGVLHRIGGMWVPEGQRAGERAVWVSQLSWFSTISSAVAKAGCLYWDWKALLTCLAGKGISTIAGDLGKWIAEKISPSCTAQIIASGVTGGKLPGVALTAFTAPACAPNLVDGPPPATSPPPSSPTPTPTSPRPAPTSAPSYYAYHIEGTCADGACGLHVREGPGYSGYPTVGSLFDGSEVQVVCQAIGETVGPSPSKGTSSDVWDKLTSGSWVADLYVSTPNTGSWSPPIPRC